MESKSGNIMIIHTKIILAIMLLLVSGCDKKSPTPTDEELIKTFNENKQIFIQLTDKIRKDGYILVSLDPKWSKPDNIQSNIKKPR